MSFITCCPACGTKFRVVTDQLRISDGWVRCGRCQEVFDAKAALEETAQKAVEQAAPEAKPAEAMPVHEQLAPQEANVGAVAAQMLEPITPPTSASIPESIQDLPPKVPQVPGSAPVAAPAADETSFSVGYELPVPPEFELDFDVPLDKALDAHIRQSMPLGDGLAWAKGLDEKSIRQEPELDVPVPTPMAEGTDAVKEPELSAALQAEENQANVWAEVLRFIHPPKPQLLEPPVVAPESVPSDADGAALKAQQQALPELAAEEQPPAVPSFVKQAQRKAWWNQPGVRFVMGMLLIFLPIALLAQIVLHERNRLAAWQPAWRSHLEQMCVALRCEIAPYKDIASVVLTGSAFAQDAQPHQYRLDLSIQNQAVMAVATPAVELTLTDAQDQVLVRKVLNLADIGAPLELPARGEWNGTLPVKTQGLNLPVAGYRVMAFYP